MVCAGLSGPGDLLALGFVMLALNKSRLFFATETLFNAVHLVLIWFGLRVVSLDGVAMAFFGMYVFYTALVYLLCEQLIGFKWSVSTLKLLAILLPVVAVRFLGARLLPIWPATALCLATTAGSSLFCLRALIQRISTQHRLVLQASQIPGLRWILNLD